MASSWIDDSLKLSSDPIYWAIGDPITFFQIGCKLGTVTKAASARPYALV